MPERTVSSVWWFSHYIIQIKPVRDGGWWAHWRKRSSAKNDKDENWTATVITREKYDSLVREKCQTFAGSSLLQMSVCYFPQISFIIKKEFIFGLSVFRMGVKLWQHPINGLQNTVQTPRNTDRALFPFAGRSSRWCFGELSTVAVYNNNNNNSTANINWRGCAIKAA